MSKKNDSRTVVPYPRERQLMVDGGQLGLQKHTIHGLVEFDITRARENIRQYRAQTGQALSFTAFFLFCLGKAIDADKNMRAYRDWRNQLVLFDDVDVSLPVERGQAGQPVVLQTVIRAANRKPVADIHREIRALQAKELGDTAWGRWLRWYVLIPGPIRRLFFRLAASRPKILKRFNGTVLVTSVGMYGKVSGWGIPLAGHSLAVTVGGIEAKPVLLDGAVCNRPHLRLTVTFDHDIIDGGPAARFIQRFAELIQAGAGLDEAPL